MKKYIYQLITNTGSIFYIGQTTDTERRKKEHEYNSKAWDSEMSDFAHHEDKYVAIRLFKEMNITWDLEVIAEVNNSDEPYEEYYMMLAIQNGCLLTNMKMGDAEMCAGNDLNSYAEMTQFITEKRLKTARTASKPKKQHSNRESTFIDDLSGVLNTESEGVRRIRAKTHKKNKYR